LRQCTTSQKAIGSIPDGVTGVIHCCNPPSHTMTLGLTQPLIEISNGKGKVHPRTGHEGPEGEVEV